MFIRKDDKISTSQAAIYLNNSILGAGILAFPRFGVQSVGTPDVWMSLLLSGMIAMMSVLIMVKLSQQFPGRTVFQYAKKIAGSPIGAVIGFIMVMYFMLIAGYELRVFAEVTLFYLLEGTPVWAIVIPFIWVATYLVHGGINSIARLYQIIIPASILILILSFGLSVRLFDINHLRPVLSEGVMPVLSGLKSMMLLFAGCEMTMVLVAHMDDPKQAAKAMVYGTSLPLILYLITIIVVIGGMSADSVMRSTWPTLDLLRSFETAGLLLERFEFPFIVIWMMQLFCNFCSFYYGASLGITQLFGAKLRPVILGITPLLYIIALMPKRINDLFGMGTFIGFTGVGLFLVLPILLSAVYIIRRKGLKQNVQ